MMIYDGNDLGERLMRLRATCRSCGRSFSFEDGGRCARRNDIDDRVVVCPHCFSCYRIDMTLSALTLLEDVTRNYPQLAGKSGESVSPAASRPSASPALATAAAVSSGAADDAAAGVTAAPAVGSATAAISRAERPGCVTAYAVLLFIGAALLSLGGLALSGSGGVSGAGTLLFIALGGLQLAIGIGLWRMHNWARALVIVVQALGVLATLVSAVSGQLGGSGILSALFSLGLSIYIIRWFAANGELFR